MEQKIVVHVKGGAVHKGVTHDFSPRQASFHVLPAEGGGVPLKVHLSEMKAMFWVKDYLGNRDYTAVQGIVILFALVVVFASLVIDFVNAYIDPRIRY